ncbi:MAG TPA: hypothetical protein VHA37_01335 [Candidatus Saccharimonadales bacterium]|nr:hypothetical protein [Candidatus Saccharimonadales bacterium]
MASHAAITLYVGLMTALIVGANLLFFRDWFWARLAANIGIVLLFTAFYLLFLRRA